MSAQTTPAAEAVVAEKPTEQQTPATPQKATSDLAKEVLSKAFGLTPITPPKPPEKKEDEKAKEEAQPAPEAKEKPAKESTPTKEEKAEKPKKTKAPDRIIPASELLGDQDESDAITKAATAAATAAVKAMAPQKQESREAAPEIPEDLQDQLEVLKELETEDRFKGITKQAIEFKRKGGLEDEYTRRWKKENPGKEYDPDDQEHEDFYQENDPTARHDDIDRAIKRAEKRILKREAVDEVRKEIEPQIREQANERRRQEMEPWIQKEADQSVYLAAAAISEDLRNTLVEKGGRAVAELDPIAAEVLDDVLPKYLPIQEEAVRMFNNLTTIKPGNLSNAQAQVIATINELQDVILSDQQHQVRQVRTPRGVINQRFVPMAQYHKLSDEEKERAWTVGGGDVVGYIRSKQNQEVKSKYDSRVKVAESWFGKKSGQATVKQEAPKKEQAATPATSAPLSPSVGGSAPPPTPTGGATKKGATGVDLFWQHAGLRE